MRMYKENKCLQRRLKKKKTRKTVFHDDVVPNLKPVIFFRWQQKSIKIPIPRDGEEFRPVREELGGAKLQYLTGIKQQKWLEMYFKIKRLGNLEDGL